MSSSGVLGRSPQNSILRDHILGGSIERRVRPQVLAGSCDTSRQNDLSTTELGSGALELRLNLSVSPAKLTPALSALNAVANGNGWCSLMCPSGFGRDPVPPSACHSPLFHS